ncbi:MAG: PIG-L family deacetylase [Actinomycetota bacterium]
MIRWVVWVIIIVTGIYLLFLAISPLLVAFLNLINTGPKDRQAAVKNGKELLETAKTVVVVGAHPDDIEWYTGGTLARLSKDGVRVIVIMATDGGKLNKTRVIKGVRVIFDAIF